MGAKFSPVSARSVPDAGVPCPLSVLDAGKSRVHARCPRSARAPSSTCRGSWQGHSGCRASVPIREAGFTLGGQSSRPEGLSPCVWGTFHDSCNCPHLGSLSTLGATSSVWGGVQTQAKGTGGLTPGLRRRLPMCGRLCQSLGSGFPGRRAGPASPSRQLGHCALAGKGACL